MVFLKSFLKTVNSPLLGGGTLWRLKVMLCLKRMSENSCIPSLTCAVRMSDNSSRLLAPFLSFVFFTSFNGNFLDSWLLYKWTNCHRLFLRMKMTFTLSRNRDKSWLLQYIEKIAEEALLFATGNAEPAPLVHQRWWRWWLSAAGRLAQRCSLSRIEDWQRTIHGCMDAWCR